MLRTLQAPRGFFARRRLLQAGDNTYRPNEPRPGAQKSKPGNGRRISLVRRLHCCCKVESATKLVLLLVWQGGCDGQGSARPLSFFARV